MATVTHKIDRSMIVRLNKRIAGIMKAVLDEIPDDQNRIEIIAHLMEVRRLLGHGTDD